jgi:hypothetical protein
MTVYNGQHRLFNQEAFGYSTLQIDTPASPSALRYDDLRYSGVPAAGDGQSYTFGSSVSPDGARAAIGLGGPGDGWGVIVGTLDYAEGFKFTGSFGIDRASALVVQVGGRYFVYGISTGGSVAADVTTLPTTMAHHNMDAQSERVSWSGYSPRVAGAFILFLNGSGLTVVDASNPGPVGSITAAMPTRVLTNSDFGGRAIQYYTAAQNGNDLLVLVELRPAAGETSYTYALVAVSRLGLTTMLVGSWRIPTAAGETWAAAGISAAISNGRVFMPAQRMAPAWTQKAWSAPVSGFPGAPVAVDVTAVTGFGQQSTSKGSYVYLPTGAAGFVIPCGAKP